MINDLSRPAIYFLLVELEMYVVMIYHITLISNFLRKQCHAIVQFILSSCHATSVDIFIDFYCTVHVLRQGLKCSPWCFVTCTGHMNYMYPPSVSLIIGIYSSVPLSWIQGVVQHRLEHVIYSFRRLCKHTSL